jgi:hypothetical protein
LKFLYIFAVIYSPFWKHILQAWKEKEDPNLCFIFYDDLKKVSTILLLQGQIIKIAALF